MLSPGDDESIFLNTLRFPWLGQRDSKKILLAIRHGPGDTTGAAPDQVSQGTVNTAGKSGADLYLETCAACHGPEGKGKEADAIGFDVPTPDFPDCSFASREPDADWVSVAHEGGPSAGSRNTCRRLVARSARPTSTKSSATSGPSARWTPGAWRTQPSARDVHRKGVSGGRGRDDDGFWTIARRRHLRNRLVTIWCA